VPCNPFLSRGHRALRFVPYTRPSPSQMQQIDGHSYERSAIEQWLETHNTSPTTGIELESKLLIPCHSLRSLILDFHEAGA
jgi:hypothetical protein